jgi:hypothetical protein
MNGDENVPDENNPTQLQHYDDGRSGREFVD